jgi:TRL-like protein family
MKKLSASVLLSSVAIMLLTGCAVISPISGGTWGGIYTKVDSGVAVGSASGSDKVGEAESTAIICFATGDSSIETAMKNGGITKIHHVDCRVMSVLGVYAKYTTVVYGE